MKIICSKNSLLTGVNIVLRAVPVKTTMDILECIVIKVDDGKIKLIGNDMSLAIETCIDGEIVDEGMIAVNAKIFSEIIRKLPDSEVVINNDNTTLQIRCDNVKFDIASRNADEFPLLSEIERDKSIKMSQLTLKDIIRQTVFSIAPENDSIKVMTGEYLEINENKLRLVGLDGHRIAIRNVELKENYGKYSVIIPGKTMNELTKILSGELDDEVTIYFGTNNILFEMEDTIVLSRLIEGKYYSVNQMISGDYDTKVAVNNKELTGCIDRSLLLIKETDKKPLIFKVTDENLEVKINTSMGRLNEKLLINKQGNDILIAFNPKYLMDAMRVIDDEEINLYMMNVKAPCIIKDKDETYMYLVLPVNFNAEDY